MKCVECKSGTKVTDSRAPKYDEDGILDIQHTAMRECLDLIDLVPNFKARTRVCSKCGKRFFTAELALVDLMPLIQGTVKVVYKTHPIDPKVEALLQFMKDQENG